MKKIIALTIFFFLSVCVFCENQTLSEPEILVRDTVITDDNTSSIIYDGTQYNFVFEWKQKKNRKHLEDHWTGIGMSFMDYDDSDIPNGRLKNSTSYAISFNPMSINHRIGGSNLLVVSGLGFDWHRYHFKGNAALTEVDGVTQFLPAPEGMKYKDSKLLAYYITVPLLLEYHFVPNNFYISAGAVGFIKYYSKSQIKYYDEDGRHRLNMGRDLNIRPIDLKLRFQIGIEYIKVFGYYSPISMFKGDKGPDLNMYSVGFMIGF